MRRAVTGVYAIAHIWMMNGPGECKEAGSQPDDFRAFTPSAKVRGITHERMMTMQTKGFDTTARQLIVGLPLFMGAIEYILRVALNQPGKDDFFPISLVASSVSLNVALAVLPAELRSGLPRWTSRQGTSQAILIANLGIFASLIGMLLWIYLLVASFSQEVRGLLPSHPLRDALVYYGLSIVLNEWKAGVSRC